MLKRVLMTATLVLLASTAMAQFQPKNVECIAPADAGGGWDFTCRVPAAQVMRDLGLVPGVMQVTNMSGGGGGIAFASVVTQRKGDDNLIVAASTATATRLAQNVFAGFTEDSVRWIGAVGADFGVIAVANDSKYATLADLMNDLAADPTSAAFAGGSAVGGWDHLKVLLLAQKAGMSNEELAKMRYVAFNGGGAAMIEVIGGRAAAFTGDVSETLTQIEAGNIRALAVLSPERLDVMPDVPTAREAGYDVIGANWRGFYMAPGTSDAAYQYWVDAVSQVGQSDEWAKLRDQNGLAPFFSVGADFEAFVKDQIVTIRDISQGLGLIQ
jgi:putative tricarboxylic transport membrane protein